ncbi:hypothetical protein SAY87_004894 [Trapa incisa]|uniref:Calcium uniporter protein C-terminal domain-containing protein n=1 Tax=Trapa incisa TaxID=236973 RepID=A0AAN7PLS2_9MYRT|nr:hypothetical protein SAY87_004894 [Trapa incisa]
MALYRTLSQRLLSCPRAPPLPPTAVSIVASPPRVADPAHPPLRREYFTSPESPEGGILRRFFQRRSLTQAAAGVLPDFLSFPVGDRLRERLRSIGTPGHRLRLDGLSRPTHASVVPQGGLSVVEARKLLKLACMERLKSKLRAISESSITYEQYLKICNQACENEDQAVELAKTMDETGNVIVLGNTVFLRPEQVAKSMEAILHQTIVMPDDPRRAELGSMEEEKSEIDSKARAQVRAELYCGLGFIVMQTLGFMRLTFWELSWDVMEPICFFVTSLHFTLAYWFFLRTSTEPSFEGYFGRRFRTKQMKLIRNRNFNIDRYNELRNFFYLNQFESQREKAHVRALGTC